MVLIIQWKQSWIHPRPIRNQQMKSKESCHVLAKKGQYMEHSLMQVFLKYIAHLWYKYYYNWLLTHTKLFLSLSLSLLNSCTSLEDKDEASWHCRNFPERFKNDLAHSFAKPLANCHESFFWSNKRLYYDIWHRIEWGTTHLYLLQFTTHQIALIKWNWNQEWFKNKQRLCRICLKQMGTE
jgi:hypothetical protein